MVKGPSWVCFCAVAALAVTTAVLPGQASLPAGCQGDRSSPPTLEALVAEALDKSQELAALRQRIEAAQAMVKPAGALPDPMASVGLENMPVGAGLQLDRDMMSGLALMLAQEVPPASRRRLMGEVQSAEAAMLAAQLQDERNDVVRKVRQTYADIQYRDETLAIALRNRDVGQDMLATAEGLYATGKVMQQDVFQAQVRLSQMLDMIVMQQQERAMSVTRLNRLLYRPPSQPLGELPRLSRTPRQVNADALRESALRDSPRLREMEARLAQAGKSESVAALGLKPSLTFSFAYMIRQRLEMEPESGDDMWSAAVGLDLPWVYRRSKVDQEVKAARAETAAAARDLDAMRNEIGAMVDELLIEIRRTDEELSLVETGLLPQAEGAYAASRASYATGAGDLLSLLDNQMNLYNLEMQRAVLLSERERAMAELDYVVGGGG